MGYRTECGVLDMKSDIKGWKYVKEYVEELYHTEFWSYSKLINLILESKEEGYPIEMHTINEVRYWK